MAHGPLRILVTVDEEDGMDGAFGMDASWLDGATNLINIDNEISNQVLVSTAAGDTVHMTRKLEFTDPSRDTALAIELSGLKGGHSGVEINKGRLNAIIGLATFLKRLTDTGIPHELASFEGGTAGCVTQMGHPARFNAIQLRDEAAGVFAYSCSARIHEDKL